LVWAIFFPGWTYEEALARFFPWAELSNDEEFYDESDYEHFQEECERYDREDDVHYYNESFANGKQARAHRSPSNTKTMARWRLGV